MFLVRYSRMCSAYTDESSVHLSYVSRLQAFGLHVLFEAVVASARVAYKKNGWLKGVVQVRVEAWAAF